MKCVYFYSCFPGFFWIEEVLYIWYGEISFYYLTINVDRSKTDQLRKGSQVVISESSNIATCPVNNLGVI